MCDSDRVPGDRALFWFNVVGVAIATALLGTFFMLYGSQLFGFMQTLMQPEPFMP
jgi:hypothetical protein